MGYRDLGYRLYERRLEAYLAGKGVPRHVGVMCDGNRRWARSAGHTDVNKGHLKGADKIFELLDWCRETGVEVVTLWLLSTDNLTRKDDELGPLLAIIEDTVNGLVDAGVARSRSDALAWCVRLTGEHADAWLAELRDALQRVQEVRAQGPQGSTAQ